ncbi:MAG: hypothetical protein WBX00_01630 [Isosphaeraceae bacterium]
MTLSIEGLVEDLETRLGRLAADPVTLVCLLLAANALVEPYRGLDHDSRLYAVQILERIHPGSFAGDLYLRYGSQDRYSVFTVLMAPLVQLCGIHAAFFCVYLASKAILFWSLLRLSRVLISSNLALILALIHLAIVPVAFGGNEIFHVNESFLTPRLSSCALVLLGLERMLTGRSMAAILLLLGSFLLHPLMAVGGILPAGLWWMAGRCTWRQCVWLALAAVALATLVIGIEPLGNRLFGHMDDVWRAISLKICFYIRPACWWWSDWIRIALECGLVVWTAAHCPVRRLATFWAAVLGSALIGLIGSLIAVNSHYLLLIQTSPYRTLWLLELLAIPAGYGLAAHLWQCGSQQSRSASLVVVLLLTSKRDSGLWASVCMILLPLLGFAVLSRGFAKLARHSDWLWRSTQNAFLATSGLMLLFNLIQLAMLFGTEPPIVLELHPVLIAMHLSGTLWVLPIIIIVTCGVIALIRVAGQSLHLRFLLLGCCAAYQALLVCAPNSDWYGRHFDVRNRHVRFVDSRLASRVAGRTKPFTIYWPTPVEDVWFGTGNNSFYNVVQMSGCAFNRGTAVEGYRRAALALPFEFERLRLFWDANDWKISLRDIFQIKGDVHFPQAEDLLRVCEEEGLDFIVLKYRIKDLYGESDGEYYIYDCEQLRNLRSKVGVHGRNRPDGRPANHDNVPVKGEGKTSTVTLRGYGPHIPRGVVLPGNTTADSS